MRPFSFAAANAKVPMLWEGGSQLQNLLAEVQAALSNDPSLLDADKKLIKNAVIDRVARLDPDLLKLLLTVPSVKERFFADVDGILVFDKARFQQFVANKEFLPDSYTAFRNKIGLTDRGGQYLSAGEDVVLAWPYKDCVLEGGMTKEDIKRDEVFWNTTLAPDDITRLFEPKALTGFELWDSEAVSAGKPKAVKRIDSAKDSLLIKGNNLLALHSLKRRYAGKVDLVYIDPPYNPDTDANTFLYNNRFNRSSWLTFMSNRIDAAKLLMRRGGSMIVAIDKNEFYYLGILLEEKFPNHEVHFITIVHNPRGAQGTNFSYTHEYAFFVIPRDQKTVSDRTIEEEDIWWSNLRNWGGESERHTAKTCFYPIYVEDGEIVGFGDVMPNDVHPSQTEQEGDRYAIYPIDSKGVERKWRYGRENVESIKHLLKVKKGKSGYEIWIGKDFGQYKTVWNDTRYDANEYGTKILKDLVPDCAFTYPKSLWTVHDCIRAIVEGRPDALIMDFFAGSGTTAHAVDELNRADGGQRRFIMVEQLTYVEKCTKARILEERRRAPVANSFVYFELAEANEAFARRIRDAGDEAALERVAVDLREKGWWRYKIDQSLWSWDEWAALGFDERKQLLIDSLDANHLYVNYGDVDDADAGLNPEDIALTKAFYEGEA